MKDTYDLEVEGPHHNFIANGIVTHNSVNEYSGRYSLMPLLFYRPEAKDFAFQSSDNRQGRQTQAPGELYADAIGRWDRLRAEAADTYGWLVVEDIARELARIDLPLSTYTQWYWKIDLHNLLHFLTLRVDPHAQWEIRAFGEIMAGMLARVAPLSYEAWLDYNVMGARLSGAEREVLHHFLEAGAEGIAARAGADPLSAEALTEFGLAPREVRELIEKLEPVDRPDFSLDLSRMQPAEAIEAKMSAAVPETSL
jgi:thymidylate synthase (FAD)